MKQQEQEQQEKKKRKSSQIELKAIAIYDGFVAHILKNEIRAVVIYRYRDKNLEGSFCYSI